MKSNKKHTDILNKYLKDPCGTLSIPYWKHCIITIPKDIKIIHYKDFDSQFADYQRYFRIIHHLQNIEEPQYTIETINIDEDSENLIEMINICYQYDNISVSLNDINIWKKSTTYNPTLYIKIVMKEKIVASGIGSYDSLCKEGTIERLQVLPSHRRMGLGKAIVNGLLMRFNELKADFVTVSGDVDNPHKPEMLYRSCGFTGNDIWYICYNK